MPCGTWLDAPGVTVREWHCAGARDIQGGEEAPAAFELSVVRTGSYRRQFADRTVLADPSRVVCGSPAEPFRPLFVVGRAARETVIALDEATFRSLLAAAGDAAADAATARFPADSLALEGRAALAHAALLRARRDHAGPLALHELALELAQSSLCGPRTPRARRYRPAHRTLEAVHATRSTLATRYPERLTLEGLARDVGLTPWHLSRHFRAVVGESVHQHLLRVRLHAALERIALRERNLSRIAFETGFSSHSHFTSAFRRAFGNAPSHALPH